MLHSLRSLDQAIRLINSAEVVAFDFDALIMRRAASGEAVLSYVGFLLRQQDKRLTGFVDRRKRAERVARMTSGQEETLDRSLIYACFPSDEVWSSTVISRALALELKIELSAPAPRLDVVALVDYAAHQTKRKIVVTDARVPRAYVMDVLKACNLLQHFDYVYLSDERSPKADPAGFGAVVAAKEAVALGAILLITGDWALAGDGAWQRDCNCAVITLANWRRVAFADSEGSCDWRSELILSPFSKRIAGHVYGVQQGQMISITTESEFGYLVLGPLLLGFMAWLFNVVALSHCGRLLFASREGYFLRNVYNRLKSRLHRDHLPEGEYVYVPPRLVLAASQVLDFDTTRILARARPSSVPLTAEVSLTKDGDHVEEVLRKPEPEIVEQAEPNPVDFLAYWRSLELNDNDTVGLIDLETSALAQEALQELIGRPLLGLYLTSDQADKNGEVTGGLAISCFHDDAGFHGSGQPKFGPTERKLLQALFTSPHGPVSHFSLDATGHPAPVFLDCDVTQKQVLELQTIFAGAEAYCNDALSSYGDNLFQALAHEQSAGLAPLRMLALNQIGLGGALRALVRGEDATERRGSIDLTPLRPDLNNPRPEIRMPNRKPVRLRVLDDLPAVYHSYALFGVENHQIPGIYARNQLSKQPIILAYIQFAIAKCKKTIADQVSFAELFCADGFFAMSAIHLGATSSYGVDNDRDDQSGVMTEIAERLGLNVSLKKMDVADIDQLEQVDIVANVGGLYHVSNPDEILEKSYRLARRFLVVQTVVSIANNDVDYFETPAPGWTWGSRYSRSSFERHLASKRWKVIDSHFNLLEGNTREEDLGSCYALIEKP